MITDKELACYLNGVLLVMHVAFRGDRAYDSYMQNVAPMENQLRDAQLVCTVFINIWTHCKVYS